MEKESRKIKQISGVGINLRLEYIDDVLENLPDLPFLEIIVDNWLSLGPHHKKLEKLRSHYDISFHCVGMNLGGVDDLDYSYLKKILELKNKFNPIHISDHACFQTHRGNSHHDLLPLPMNKASLKNISERVLKVQDFMNEAILLENLSYYIEYETSDMTEYDFLNQISFKTDCYFLLDFNNIWVNSKNLKVDLDKYLEEIKWERVKEIHVAGAEKFDDLYIDTHGTGINNEVLKIAKNCKDKLKNLPIIYERDNHIPSLNQLMEETQKMMGAIHD